MKSALALIFATLFWAGNYVVGHLAVQAMSPLALTWWRWLLASVPLLVLAQVVEKPDWRTVLTHWPRLLLLAALPHLLKPVATRILSCPRVIGPT